MSKKDSKIEPIDGSFDSVAKAVISSKNLLKEITSQPSLDLGIEVERWVNGIGMGVTPYKPTWFNNSFMRCSMLILEPLVLNGM